MASFVTDIGMRSLLDGSIQVGTTPLKLMLVKSSYTSYAATDTNLTTLTTNEIVATNYTGGFGGSGRKSVTAAAAATASGAKITLGNVTWTALGGATNDTVGLAVLIRENTSNADSIPVVYLDISDTPTNGSDIVISMDSVNGQIRFTV
jgi:uncharacterized protein YdaL